MNYDAEIVRKIQLLLTKKMEREEKQFEKLLAMNNSPDVLYEQGLASDGYILARCIHIAGPQRFYLAIGSKNNCAGMREYFCG